MNNPADSHSEEPTLEEDLSKANEEIQAILAKYQAVLSVEFSFPRYQVVPDELKIVLNSLQHHGLVVKLALKPLQ